MILTRTKKGVPKPLVLLMFLLDETTLLIFEMVSFQALPIQPKDFCGSYRGCSKTISFVLFFFNMKPLSVFLAWFHFKIVLIFVDFLHIWEMQWQKHWLYNCCIQNDNKSIAFITKTNLRTKPNFVKMD